MERILKNKNGYSFAEVVIAMVIMGIVALLVGTILTTSTKMHRSSFSSDDAYAVAREKLAQFQQDGVAQDLTGNDTVPRNNISYYRGWVLTPGATTVDPVTAVITVNWSMGTTSKSISITGYVQCNVCDPAGTTNKPTIDDLTNPTAPRNTPPPQTVAALSVTDADVGDLAFYEIHSSSENKDKFDMSNNLLITKALLTTGTYNVTVVATDCDDNESDPKTFAVVVPTNNTPPVINTPIPTMSIPENSSVNTIVDKVTATNGATQWFMYPISPGATPFIIDNGGNVRVDNSINYESTYKEYIVEFMARNGAGDSPRVRDTITVTDVNEPPTNIVISNSLINTYNGNNDFIGTLTALGDPEDATATYTFSLNDGSNSIKLDNTNNNLVYTNTAGLHPDTITVEFIVADGQTPIARCTTNIDIAIRNRPPHGITPSDIPYTYSMGVSPGDQISTISANDSDIALSGGLEKHIFNIVGGDENYFDIPTNSNTIIVQNALSVQNYSLEIEVIDKPYDGSLGERDTFTLPISVSSSNNNPHSVLLDGNTSISMNENLGASYNVGTISAVDPDNDNLTFTIESGVLDAAQFSITSATSTTANLLTSQNLTAGTYSINVYTTDDGTPPLSSSSQTLTIHVTSGNTAPHSLALDNTSINANLGAAYTVGTLSATDDENDNLSYYFDGGTDDSRFRISGDQLETNENLPEGSYSIRIYAQDDGVGSLQSSRVTFNIIVSSSGGSEPCAGLPGWINGNSYSMGDSVQVGGILYECTSPSWAGNATYQPGSQYTNAWNPIDMCGNNTINTNSPCGTATEVTGGATISANGCYFFDGYFNSGSFTIAWATVTVNGTAVAHGQWWHDLPAPIDGGYYIEFTKSNASGSVTIPSRN